MSSKKKKKQASKIGTKKKILEGIDTNKEFINKEKNPFDTMIKELRKDLVDVEFEKGKEKNLKEKSINDQIQSFVSILFTIVIFVLLLVLIFVIYNNYIKKEEINVAETCKDYIKKDYGIKQEDVISFIKNTRNVLYNIEQFDNENLENKDLIELSKYIIWGSDTDYLVCLEDEYCLDTKKEMDVKMLSSILKSYLGKSVSLKELEDVENDSIRIYRNGEKVILTFKEMEYETLKHDIIKIEIDENRIEIYFALSKKIENYYNYIGYKKVNLEYEDNSFQIKKIETVITNKS